MTQTTDQIQELLSQADVGMKDKIELLRLKLESERLMTENRRFSRENKFLNRNLAAALTFIISLAAVFISLSQVWVAKIQKERELSVTESQRNSEMQATQSQKEKETLLMAEQQNKSWRLEMAKFIADHRNELFGKDAIQKALMRNVVLTSFPTDISEDFFRKLEVLSTSNQERRMLRIIRKEILPQMNRPDAEVSQSTWRYVGDSDVLANSDLRTIFNNVAKNIK